MDGNPFVVDLSSDEEFGLKEDGDDDTDYYSWLSKFLVDDETEKNGRGKIDGDGSDDDVFVVGEVLARKPKRKRKSISNSPIADEVGDDDCVVLEVDPDKESGEGKGEEDGSDELVIVGEKGQVACRDYPHSRNQCAKFPFKSTPHNSYCDLCHCYVCDSPAPCSCWGTGESVSDHCHATDKEEFWQLERKRIRMEKNPPPPVPNLTRTSFSTAQQLCYQVQPPQSAPYNVSSAWNTFNGSLQLPQLSSPTPIVSTTPSICRMQPQPPTFLGSSNTSVSLAPSVYNGQNYPHYSCANASVTTDRSYINQTAVPPQPLHSFVPSPQYCPQLPHLARSSSFGPTTKHSPSPHQMPYSSLSVPSARPLYRSTSHPTQLANNSFFYKDFQIGASTNSLNSSFGVPNIISQSSRRPIFSTARSGTQRNFSHPHLSVCSNNSSRGGRRSGFTPGSAASRPTYKMPRVSSRALGTDQSILNPSGDFNFSISQQQKNVQHAAQPPETIPFRLPDTSRHENLEMLLQQASSLLGLDQIATEPTAEQQKQQYDPPITHSASLLLGLDPSVQSQMQQYDPPVTHAVSLLPRPDPMGTDPSGQSQTQQYNPPVSRGSDTLSDHKQTNFAVAADTNLLYAGSNLLNDPIVNSQRSLVVHSELGKPLSGTEFSPLDEEQQSFPNVMSPSSGGLMDCPSAGGFGFDSWILEDLSASGEATFLSRIHSVSNEPASLDVGNNSF